MQNEQGAARGETHAGDIQSIIDLVAFLAKSLVDEPESVSVTKAQGETATILELSVAPGDVGKVIGRQGRIAKAVRAVVKATASKKGVNVVLEIV